MDTTDGGISVNGRCLSEQLYHPLAAQVEPNCLAETEVGHSARKSDRRVSHLIMGGSDSQVTLISAAALPPNAPLSTALYDIMTPN